MATDHDWVSLEGVSWCQDCGKSARSPYYLSEGCIYKGKRLYPLSADVPRHMLEEHSPTIGEQSIRNSGAPSMRGVEASIGLDLKGATAATSEPAWVEVIRIMREAGWSVAVHNDYRQNGERMTFWLFTHPDGWWLKGEGRTDAEAISEVWRSILKKTAVMP